jgi:hypothetical protein
MDGFFPLISWIYGCKCSGTGNRVPYPEAGKKTILALDIIPRYFTFICRNDKTFQIVHGFAHLSHARVDLIGV